MAATCHNSRTRNKGFTLVEMLVYVAILLIVSTASVLLLISLDDLVDQYQLDTALYRSSSNVLERVMVGIRQADQFDALDSVLDDSALGALSVIAGVDETRFVKNGTALELIINDVNQGNLVNDLVSVTGFTVRRYDTALGQFIRIELDLSATVDGTTRDRRFNVGGVIRGAI